MIAINAHYDGRVIVPDEPVDLLPNQARMSRPQLKVGAAGKFILRYFLGNVRWLFSSENDGESPEVLMTDDLPEMLFGE